MAASAEGEGVNFFVETVSGIIRTWEGELTWLRGAEGQLERRQAGRPAGEGQRVVVVEHGRHCSGTVALQCAGRGKKKCFTVISPSLARAELSSFDSRSRNWIGSTEEKFPDLFGRSGRAGGLSSLPTESAAPSTKKLKVSQT